MNSPPYSGIEPDGIFPRYFPKARRDSDCPIQNGWNTLVNPVRRKVGLGYGTIAFSMYGGKEAFTDAGGKKHSTFPREHVYLPADTMYSVDRRRYDAAGRLQSYGFMAYPYRDWSPWIDEKYVSTRPVPVPSLYKKSRSLPESDE